MPFDNNALIANNEASLNQFILDLAGFSLEKQGMLPEAYAFHLQIAFRRQLILNPTRWQALCDNVITKPRYWNLDDPAQGLNDLKQFTETLIVEVKAAANDPWGMKLIKTCYLSTLDKARKASEDALQRFDEQAYVTDSLVDDFDEQDSLFDEVNRPANTPERALIMDSLSAHIDYLDSLLALPFIVERVSRQIAKNRGVNYLPEKNAEVLASILNTASQACDQKLLIKSIQIALSVAMPTLPADKCLLQSIETELLPFINNIIDKNRLLEAQKNNLLPSGHIDITKARQELLSTLGVSFDSLSDILRDTLLTPAKDCRKLIDGVSGLVEATGGILLNDSKIDIPIQIAHAFAHIDELAQLSDDIDPQLWPKWLLQTKNYYQLLKGQAIQIGTSVDNLWNKFGIFYNGVASYIPESIYRYFTASDDLDSLLKSINDPINMSSKETLIVLEFHDLVTKGDIEESLQDVFFDAYLEDVAKAHGASQSQNIDYKATLTQFNFTEHLNQSLNDYIEQINTETNSPDVKQKAMLCCVHRLKQIELSWDYALKYKKPLEPFLKELIEAKKTIKRETVSPWFLFREKFLNETINRLLLQYEQVKLIPMLETYIDNPSQKNTINQAYQDQLPKAYSSLKIGNTLTRAQLQGIQDCLCNTQEFKILSSTEWPLLSQLSPKVALDTGPSNVNKTVETPRQQMCHSIKENLKTLSPVIDTLTNRLQGIIEECCALKSLCASESEGAKLCTAKIEYCEAIKTCLIELNQTIKNNPDDFAKQLTALINGDAIHAIQNPINSASILTLGNQLIKFAWFVLPNHSTDPNNTLLQNAIHCYLNETNIEAVFNAKTAYEQAIGENPIPALMSQFSDPLTLTGFMPNQEQVLDSVINQLIDYTRNNELFINWSMRFANQVGAYVLNEDFILHAFPSLFLGKLALQVLKSSQTQQLMGQLLTPLKDKLKANFGKQAESLVEITRNKVYGLLGIEILKSLENIAIRGAAQLNNHEKSDELEQRAFATFYLQYQAIIHENPNADRKKIIKFLFKAALLDQSKPEKQSIYESLIVAFTSIDNQLALSANPLDKASSEQDIALLNSLVQQIQFNDPAQSNALYLILLNRLLVLQLDTVNLINQEDKVFIRQECAVSALAQILNKMPAPSDSDSLIECASIVELAELKPATEKAKKQLLARNLATIATLLSSMTTEKNDRLERLDNNQIEPLLGHSKGWIELKSLQNKPLRGIISIALLFMNILSAVSFWGALIAPFITGSKAVIQAALVFLGLASAIGTSATVYGAIIIAAITAIRVAVKFMIEIYQNRHAFNDMAHNEAYSIFKKIGLITLLTLKCLGSAALKTAFTDFVVTQVTTLFAIEPLKQLRNAVRTYPSEATLNEEVKSIKSIETTLARIRSLIEPDNIDTEALKIAKATLLNEQKSNTFLNTQLKPNDIRNTKEWRNSQAQYKKSIVKVCNLLDNLNVTLNADKWATLQTKSKAIDSNAIVLQPPLAAETIIANPAQKEPVIDLAAYYKKCHPTPVAMNTVLATTATTIATTVTQATMNVVIKVIVPIINDSYNTLISGFYQLLVKANTLLPKTTATQASSTDLEFINKNPIRPSLPNNLGSSSRYSLISNSDIGASFYAASTQNNTRTSAWSSSFWGKNSAIPAKKDVQPTSSASQMNTN